MAKIFPGRDAPADYLMVLRGAAVIGVLLGHLFGIGPLSIGAVVTKASWSYTPHSQPFETWRSIVEILTPLIGMNFVILFFVQSGYLMGKVFFEGRYDAKTGKRHFYLARYLRLAPLLYFNLLICIGLFRYADLSPTKLVGEFLFLNNVTGFGLNNVTWSLSYEMQYYLICPFIFLAVRATGRWAPASAIALAVGAYYLGQKIPLLGFTCAFLGGFCVNLIPKRTTTGRTKKLGLLLGLLVLHVGFNALSFMQFVELPVLLAIAASAALVYMCECPTSETFAPFVLRIGEMTGYLTYGIYLWHYAIIMTRSGDCHEIAQSLAKTLDLAKWQTVGVYHLLELAMVLPISYILSYATFVLIESRFRPSLYSGVMAHQRKAEVTSG